MFLSSSPHAFSSALLKLFLPKRIWSMSDKHGPSTSNACISSFIGFMVVVLHSLRYHPNCALCWSLLVFWLAVRAMMVSVPREQERKIVMLKLIFIPFHSTKHDKRALFCCFCSSVKQRLSARFLLFENSALKTWRRRMPTPHSWGAFFVVIWRVHDNTQSVAYFSMQFSDSS